MSDKHDPTFHYNPMAIMSNELHPTCFSDSDTAFQISRVSQSLASTALTLRAEIRDLKAEIQELQVLIQSARQDTQFYLELIHLIAFTAGGEFIFSINPDAVNNLLSNPKDGEEDCLSAKLDFDKMEIRFQLQRT